MITREVLRQALADNMDLLQEAIAEIVAGKEVITQNELLDRAGMKRSTFYALGLHKDPDLVALQMPRTSKDVTYRTEAVRVLINKRR